MARRRAYLRLVGARRIDRIRAPIAFAGAFLMRMMMFSATLHILGRCFIYEFNLLLGFRHNWGLSFSLLRFSGSNPFRPRRTVIRPRLPSLGAVRVAAEGLQ